MYVRAATREIWSLCAQRPLTAVRRSGAVSRPGLILVRWQRVSQRAGS